MRVCFAEANRDSKHVACVVGPARCHQRALEQRDRLPRRGHVTPHNAQATLQKASRSERARNSLLHTGIQESPGSLLVPILVNVRPRLSRTTPTHTPCAVLHERCIDFTIQPSNYVRAIPALSRCLCWSITGNYQLPVELPVKLPVIPPPLVHYQGFPLP